MKSKIQRKLIAEIRRLFARGEPLNICAVKRDHPELMKAVYAINPFWGWKRALESARIDYSKIKVQLEPYVACQICGEQMSALASHLVGIHGTNKDDYHIDYPDAPMVSEDMQARFMMGRRRLAEHWEPNWSPEYVLDRIAEFRRRNLRINSEWIANNEPALFHKATVYFGNWGAALKAVGLDPVAIYREFEWRYPSKKKVIAEIRLRWRKGLPVNYLSLRRGIKGIKDNALWLAGRALFGSWRAAIVAAGIDPINLLHTIYRARRIYGNKQTVIREIRRRRAAGLDVYWGGIARGKHPNATLPARGIEYFGSWNAALKAAGIDPKQVASAWRAKRMYYPNSKAVVSEIKRRAKEGLPVNSAGVLCREPTDQPLWKAARRFLGSWNAGLKAAGLDPFEVSHTVHLARRLYGDKQSVIREIRRRHAAGLAVNWGGIARGKHSNPALPKRGIEYFGSWKAALKAAGLDPDVISAEIYRRYWRYPDREAVVRGITRRRQAGLPVNFSGVASAPHRDKALLLSAKALFSSWPNALKAAGINPATIQRKVVRKGQTPG